MWQSMQLFARRMIGLGEGRGVWFVAAQAALGKLGEIVLRRMHIVAGEAGHGRCAGSNGSASTSRPGCREHRAAVFGSALGKLNVFVQRLAGQVRKRRLQRLAVAGVAPGAKIHLAIAGEVCRVQDGRGSRSRLRLSLARVPFPGRDIFRIGCRGRSRWCCSDWRAAAGPRNRSRDTPGSGE